MHLRRHGCNIGMTLTATTIPLIASRLRHYGTVFIVMATVVLMVRVKTSAEGACVEIGGDVDSNATRR